MRRTVRGWRSATSRRDFADDVTANRGEAVDEHESPSLLELEAQLDALRGEIDLKIPAASAVKIGGERAYKLHRRGVAVEMPTRRTTVYELELEEYEEPMAQLSMQLSSGGYVRAVAEALGGHCVSLRRTHVASMPRPMRSADHSAGGCRSPVPGTFTDVTALALADEDWSRTWRLAGSARGGARTSTVHLASRRDQTLLT
jgi:hypothetical protein